MVQLEIHLLRFRFEEEKEILMGQVEIQMHLLNFRFVVVGVVVEVFSFHLGMSLIHLQRGLN